MGTYLNPGNDIFSKVVKSDYVDKTDMIGLINGAIDTGKNLICVSRPRRFGKSYAARMLCAYYDKFCDSHALFENLKISNNSSFEKHINQYNVIYLDMSQILGDAGKEKFIDFIKTKINEEIHNAYPNVRIDSSFISTLVNTAETTGTKFIAIIDEWDVPIRELSKNERSWLEFLRMLFKSSGTTDKIFAAAYMTGILPIKKDGSQSAISDFREYTILDPLEYSDYVGFTEDEVRHLCEQKNRCFDKVKRWYDGYTVGDKHSIYNPYSVMCALENGKYISYWKKTRSEERRVGKECRSRWSPYH